MNNTARATILALLGLVCVVLMTCGCSDARYRSMREGSDNITVDIPFSHPSFSQGRFCPQFAQAFNAVIRSEDEWHSLFSQYTQWIVRMGVDDPLPPDVDFDNEMLIFMCGGAHPTGGYSLTIKGVTLYSDRLVVTCEEVSPGPDDVVTMAFTYTGDLVKVPRYDLPVEFVRVAEPL